MMQLVLAGSTDNPTFISSYGPVIAAGVALIGVFITLWVNVKRDQARYQSQREDDYRREQRTAIAAVVVAAYDFGDKITTIRYYFGDDRDRYESFLATMAKVQDEVIVALLLVHDPLVENALNDVLKAWRATVETIRRWEQARRDPSRDESEPLAALAQFRKATANLQGAAVEKLKPTILETR